MGGHFEAQAFQLGGMGQGKDGVLRGRAWQGVAGRPVSPLIKAPIPGN